MPKPLLCLKRLNQTMKHFNLCILNAKVGKKNETTKKALKKSLQGSQVKMAASYSPALHCSTIGAGGLNFSVRNGKRWDPAAITT